MYARLRNARTSAFNRYWIISSAILVLLSPLSSLFALLFAVNAVLSIVFQRAIAKWFITTADCYNCGDEFDLDHTTWGCGCGFKVAGAHLFDSCPGCGGICSKIACPSCEVTLLV